MRHLLLGSFFSLLLIGASDADSASTGNGAVLTLAKPLPDRNAWANTSVRGDEALTQQYITTEMKRLAARLSLTPSQEVAVKAAMEAFVHRTATQTVDEVIREVCGAGQVASWEQLKSESRINGDAQQRAFLESKRIANLLDLDGTQQNQVSSALYPVELKGQNTVTSIRSAADWLAFDATQMREREAALSQILTPGQLVTYRLDNEHRLAAAKAAFYAPIGLQPASSLPARTSTTFAKPLDFTLSGHVDP